MCCLWSFRFKREQFLVVSEAEGGFELTPVDLARQPHQRVPLIHQVPEFGLEQRALRLLASKKATSGAII